MDELTNTAILEQLIERLRKTIKSNNALLKQNNELQQQVIELLKKKKRCKNCKKE